jgi:hypothetical protein
MHYASSTLKRVIITLFWQNLFAKLIYTHDIEEIQIHTYRLSTIYSKHHEEHNLYFFFLLLYSWSNI